MATPPGAQTLTGNLCCAAKAKELLGRSVCLKIPPPLPNGREGGRVNDLSDIYQLFGRKKKIKKGGGRPVNVAEEFILPIFNYFLPHT